MLKNAMHDSETEHAVCATMKELVESVQELFKAGRILPALILLYSAMDIFGSWLRPKPNAKTSGEDFRKWVDRYLLNGSQLSANSEDLWSARCGLLHTNTPSSDWSRTGKAKEIHYVRCNKELVNFMQKEILKAGEPKVILEVDMLFDAFISGMVKFGRDIQTDRITGDTVFHHAKAMFSLHSYKMPTKQSA